MTNSLEIAEFVEKIKESQEGRMNPAIDSYKDPGPQIGTLDQSLWYTSSDTDSGTDSVLQRARLLKLRTVNKEKLQ